MEKVKEKILPNRMLLSEWYKEHYDLADVEIAAELRYLHFEAVIKLTNKLQKYRREGKLFDGMILKMTPRKIGFTFVGKVRIVENEIDFEKIEIYV
ncbi:hypothetical protein M2139_000534 [Enterococcus sp. PF1-24]|uniref:hypothetical protein n=1 Tax=unclassified Enterococcus TaxID=2608891 RepID=UPI00247329F7|nr:MULTISPECIES: hypothetical protein [unclassified Enterococcus]MDH6363697.1 hypothetical protein [Enterococcus sp. PFB1-1]MDH6400653.1 hypothetical protein [Enterococcus sp. PF1-24]